MNYIQYMQNPAQKILKLDDAANTAAYDEAVQYFESLGFRGKTASDLALEKVHNNVLFDAGTLPEVNVTAQAWGDGDDASRRENYQKARKAKREKEEKQQQHEMNQSIREATDKWGKGIGLGMVTAASVPVLSGAMAGMNAIRAAHPIATGLWDAYWAGDGIVRNLFGDSGVKKTIRLAKEGDTWGALKSGAGDALDLLGAADILQLGTKIANPLYRAGYAYVNISPAGYDRPVQKAVNYTSDLLTGKPADLSHPKWEGQVDPRRTANYIVGHGLPGEMEDQAQTIATMTRDDAWRKYLGLPEKYGMYIKNADGTYSYNLQKINAIADGKLTPDLTHTSGDIEIPFADNDWNGYDFVTGAGGGLTGNTSKLTHIDPDGTKHGIQTITDTWDLHPFSRPGDKIMEKAWGAIVQPVTSKVVNRLHSFGNTIGYDTKAFKKAFDSAPEFEKEWLELDMFPRPNRVLTKIGNTLRDVDYPKMPTFVKKLDSKIAKYEVGPILGGKPFVMRTDLPIKVTSEIPTSQALSPIRKIQYQKAMRDLEYPGTIDDYLKELGPEVKVKLDLKNGGEVNYLNYFN